MPELVLGLGLLIWMVFLHLTLGMLSLTLAHITFCLSYVIVTVRSRLQTFDASLIDAARDLGANSFQLAIWIIWPLLRPAVLAGWIMAFMLSFDDFIISFYTSGVGMDTLPIKLYSMIKYTLNPDLYALSSLLILAGFGFMVAILLLNRQRAK